MTRASSAYTHHWNDESSSRQSFLCVRSFLRPIEYKDSNGVFINGIYLEPAVTNLCLRSNELDNASWTSVNGTESANSAVGPNGKTILDGIVGDATDDKHGVTQAITLTAASYAISVFAKVGNKNYLYIEDSTLANAHAYFTLTGSGTAGTPGAGADNAYIENWGGGLYRCVLVVTGTAASHTIGVYAADSDSDNTFAGDATTTNIHAGSCQVELGTVASSPIDTTSATVTRATDTGYSYEAGDNIGGEDNKRIISDFSFYSSGTGVFWEVSDGGSAADAITFGLTNDGYAELTCDATLGTTRTLTGSVDLRDGNKHDVSIFIEDGLMECSVDESQIATPNTSIVAADIANDLDEINITPLDSGSLVFADLAFFENDQLILETISTTDSAASGWVRDGNPSETVEVTEQLTKVFDAVRDQDDSVSVTEVVGVEQDLSYIEIDNVSVTEDTTIERSRFRTISETISVTEEVDVDKIVAVIERSAADTVSVTESVSTEQDKHSIISETVVATDADSRTRTRYTGADDSISVTESTDNELSYHVTESDIVSVTESVAAGKCYYRTETDLLTVTESVAADIELGTTLSEVISVTESVGIEMDYSLALSETVEVIENADNALTYNLTVSETISTVENLIINLDILKTIPVETLSVTESLSVTKEFGPTISELVIAIEELVTEADYIRTVTDTIAVTDQISREFVSPELNPVFSESVNVTERVIIESPIQAFDTIETLINKLQQTILTLAAKEQAYQLSTRFQDEIDDLNARIRDLESMARNLVKTSTTLQVAVKQAGININNLPKKPHYR